MKSFSITETIFKIFYQLSKIIKNQKKIIKEQKKQTLLLENIVKAEPKVGLSIDGKILIHSFDGVYINGKRIANTSISLTHEELVEMSKVIIKEI